MEEGQEGCERPDEADAETDDGYAKEPSDAGVEIVSDVDVPAFMEASKSAYSDVPNLTLGMFDRAHGVRAAMDRLPFINFVVAAPYH